MTNKTFSSLQYKADRVDSAGDVSREFVLRYMGDVENKYSDHDVNISRHADGAMSFSSDHAENFIYLYPQQIKHLKKILAIRPPNKFKGTKKQHKFRETARQAE